MPPAFDAAAAIEAALRERRFDVALAISERLLEESPRHPHGLLGRARCLISLCRFRNADADVADLLALAPFDPLVLLMAGIVHHRLGRSDQAVAVLSPLLDRQPPNRTEVAVVLAEALHMADRHDELAGLMQRHDVWGDDPRGLLPRAQLLEATDPEAAIAMLAGTTRGDFPAELGRINGFAAVEMLDRTGRHREAFDLATDVHARFTPPFDLDRYLAPIGDQRALLARGTSWCRPRAEPVQGMALIVGLPRSGTSLLEQMLDAHPDITGIGEYEGLMLMEEALVAGGLWPAGLEALDVRLAGDLQDRYLRGAVAARRTSDGWLLDKGLWAWRMLPAVAAVLPGAVCLHVRRDPRDTAISLFLSHFHAHTAGWTASLETIHRLIEAERTVVPEMVEALGIPHAAVVYEDLVVDPASHAGRCLDRLGLALVDDVIHPERNRRTVPTLSHAQVKRPINARSIGRWRNYAWAFDDRWNELAERHESSRRKPPPKGHVE